MEVGTKIGKLLNDCGMSQRDLANRICLDETIVSRIIKNERVPKIDVLSNIATALHVTTDYLLDRENEKKFNEEEEVILIARNKKNISDETRKKIIDILSR